MNGDGGSKLVAELACIVTVGDVDKSNAEEEMDGTGGLRKVADLDVHGLSIGNGRFCTKYLSI